MAMIMAVVLQALTAMDMMQDLLLQQAKLVPLVPADGTDIPYIQ